MTCLDPQQIENLFSFLYADDDFDRSFLDQVKAAALRGINRHDGPLERIHEAEQVILRLTMDHNSTPNYVQGFEMARDYFAKYGNHG